jgi:prepilin-type N-terminal cleavage/methylation domain-containing protein/prepilin-type processing-associated H-X9-DG protein
MKARRAFTLIELLVVIAIIAILAAILFPVFAQARAKAHQAACFSNQKQIGHAFMMYVQDYDEAFPMGSQDWTVPGWMWWPEIISPYIKNKLVFQCPGSRYRGPSYVTNAFITHDNRDYKQLKVQSTRVAVIDSPAQVLLEVEQGRDGSQWYLGLKRDGTSMYDAADYQVGFNQPLVPLGSGYGGAEGDNYMRYPPHLDGANFILCDGHAKWYKTSAMSCSGCVAGGPCSQPKWWTCPGGDPRAPKEPKFWQNVTWSPGTGVVKTIWGNSP